MGTYQITFRHSQYAILLTAPRGRRGQPEYFLSLATLCVAICHLYIYLPLYGI